MSQPVFSAHPVPDHGFFMQESFTHSLLRPARQTLRQRPQRGLTLVELLVAMVLGLLITLAAASALLVSRQGFSTVDAASQLRDNSRFVRDLIQQLVVQAGYKDMEFVAMQSPTSATATAALPPNVYGLNNQSRASVTTKWRDGTVRAAGSVGYGSDILVLRYQTSKSSIDPLKSDQNIIDCMGAAPTSLPENANDRLVSILHVGMDTTGEPSLMCSSAASNDAPNIKADGTPQPLIRGVENFQVLYGVDGVVPGNTTLQTADSVPERYLRADQMTTDAQWARVRSIRIGMVLRGPPNSAPEKASQTYFPFGRAKASASGAAGSAYALAADPGTTFTPALDGRLRQTLSFTVHLRNHQEAQ